MKRTHIIAISKLGHELNSYIIDSETSVDTKPWNINKIQRYLLENSLLKNERKGGNCLKNLDRQIHINIEMFFFCRLCVFSNYYPRLLYFFKWINCMGFHCRRSPIYHIEFHPKWLEIHEFVGEAMLISSFSGLDNTAFNLDMVCFIHHMVKFL